MIYTIGKSGQLVVIHTFSLDPFLIIFFFKLFINPFVFCHLKLT